MIQELGGRDGLLQGKGTANRPTDGGLYIEDLSELTLEVRSQRALLERLAGAPGKGRTPEDRGPEK